MIELNVIMDYDLLDIIRNCRLKKASKFLVIGNDNYQRNEHPELPRKHGPPRPSPTVIQ